MLLRSRDRDRVIIVTHGQTPLGLIPILHPEATETVIIQAEAMVPLDHHIQVVAVPPVTVLDQEAPEVEAEVVLEVDNIKYKFNDDEKVHPPCSNVIIIPNGNLFSVHR